MTSDYYVAFQYTQKAGGYCGNRFRVSYKSKADFELSRSSGNTIVLEEGISEAKSLDLTSLTPEVSRLTAAIHEACYREDGRLDENHFEHQLHKAVFAINEDRKHIQARRLKRTDIYEKWSINPAVTEKDRLLNAVLEAPCVNLFGQVDLEEMSYYIRFTIIKILTSCIGQSLKELGYDD